MMRPSRLKPTLQYEKSSPGGYSVRQYATRVDVTRELVFAETGAFEEVAVDAAGVSQQLSNRDGARCVDRLQREVGKVTSNGIVEA